MFALKRVRSAADITITATTVPVSKLSPFVNPASVQNLSRREVCREKNDISATDGDSEGFYVKSLKKI